MLRLESRNYEQSGGDCYERTYREPVWNWGGDERERSLADGYRGQRGQVIDEAEGFEHRRHKGHHHLPEQQHDGRYHWVFEEHAGEHEDGAITHTSETYDEDVGYELAEASARCEESGHVAEAVGQKIQQISHDNRWQENREGREKTTKVFADDKNRASNWGQKYEVKTAF